MRRAALVAAVLLGGSAAASAHEVRPAYLELKETGPETLDVLFKVPARGDELRLALYLDLPADFEELREARTTFAENACIERRTVRRAGGWIGATIRVAGLSATLTDALVRVERRDGTTQIARLTPTAPSFVVEGAPSRWEVVRAYSRLGVEHILTGIDHLLFVLALMIVTRGGWKLVKTVTAFTVSHSVTLTAATLGWVHVPSAPVEAVIALSILFVAAEIVHGRRGRPGVTARAPWLVAFTFGLLHGLGFAGGLSDAGLPEKHVPLALLHFSLGVETGHLLFVGGVLALGWIARELLPRATGARVGRLSSVQAYAIGGISAFWFVERVAGL